ncbi:PIN domain-containing protein [Acidobacteriota bacterium]
MKVLVDTCVWSLALRRRKKTRSESKLISLLEDLIGDLKVVMIGPIRQEILSGIRDKSQFLKVRERLRAFPDLPIESEIYENAAMLFNRCRAKGIQGSNTDFLMCAISETNKLEILTIDRDFRHFRSVIGLKLYPLPEH